MNNQKSFISKVIDSIKAHPKAWIIGIILFFVIGGIGSAMNPSKETKAQNNNLSSEATQTTTLITTTTSVSSRPSNILSYYNKSDQELENQYGVKFQDSGTQSNMTLEDNTYKIYLESTDKTKVNYVSIDLKSFGECKADSSIVSKVDDLLKAVNLDSSKKGNNLRPENKVNQGDVLYQNIIPNTYTNIVCSKLTNNYRVILYTNPV